MRSAQLTGNSGSSDRHSTVVGIMSPAAGLTRLLLGDRDCDGACSGPVPGNRGGKGARWSVARHQMVQVRVVDLEVGPGPVRPEVAQVRAHELRATVDQVAGQRELVEGLACKDKSFQAKLAVERDHPARLGSRAVTRGRIREMLVGLAESAQVRHDHVGRRGGQRRDAPVIGSVPRPAMEQNYGRTLRS